MGTALPPCLCAPIHWHFRLPSSNNAPATSLLRPSSRPPTRIINDYYHLIYVLYAYRSLSRPLRCLISASGQLSAALRRPYPRSNRARATEYVWRIVADGHGSETTVYLKSLQPIFGLFPHHLSQSVDAIRMLLLAHPRLFCGVASSRPLSLELICLLRVALIVDAVKWGVCS